jgi:hypothetical protein
MAKVTAQNYPRINDGNNPLVGCLDDSTLKEHPKKISSDQMTKFIIDSIKNAEDKSSREILKIPDKASKEEVLAIYKNEGKELFKYFKKYPGDPAATACQLTGENFHDVGVEQFRLRTLQKERMNSGWRYQFLAFDCAKSSGRFTSVADIGAAEADFNAVIEFKNSALTPLSLYVSVKNRMNTMGGQDWPKAIRALEQIAVNDKNKRGPYLCVFGLTMEGGKKSRTIKGDSKTKQPHSVNTEIWLADYFWPFFANYTYKEIMEMVLDILLSNKKDELSSKIEVPEELLIEFGRCCTEAGLVDDKGVFNNPHKLVDFFCK